MQLTINTLKSSIEAEKKKKKGSCWEIRKTKLIKITDMT